VTEAWYYLAGLIILVTLDLLTEAVRVSLLHANLVHMLVASDSPEQKVQRVRRLLQNIPRLRASLNLVQTIWRFLLAVLLFLFLSSQPLDLPVIVSIGVLLLVAWLLLGVEWLVRARVSRSPRSWALSLAPIANSINFFTWPFVTLILKISGEVQETLEDTSAVIEDQLITLVDSGQERGLIEKGESQMIHSIFELGDTLAREIMVPRIDILALDVLTPLQDALDAFIDNGHSRVPVYQENADQILGLLYAKDLLRVWREDKPIESLRTLLRPAYFVPEAKKINDLLAEMQSQRVHMAIVVDEYGGVAGLVTLEDIVEEILGEILDEYDQGEEMPYQALTDGEYLFLGRIALDDFNEVLSTQLSKDEADTLGGFIYHRLGKVPSVGESVQIDDLILTVEQVSGRRIRKVRASRLPQNSQKDETIRHVDG
jgi:putative hemolysin